MNADEALHVLNMHVAQCHDDSPKGFVPSQDPLVKKWLDQFGGAVGNAGLFLVIYNLPEGGEVYKLLRYRDVCLGGSRPEHIKYFHSAPDEKRFHVLHRELRVHRLMEISKIHNAVLRRSAA